MFLSHILCLRVSLSLSLKCSGEGLRYMYSYIYTYIYILTHLKPAAPHLMCVQNIHNSRCQGG